MTSAGDRRRPASNMGAAVRRPAAIRWTAAAGQSAAAALLLVLLAAAPAQAAGDQAAGDYVDLWGPPVGSAIPVLEAPDQSGETRGLADLAGRQGLLLFLVRSADW